MGGTWGGQGRDLRGRVTCREGEVGEGGCPPSRRFWGFTFWLLGLVPVALSTRANGGAGVLLALGRVRHEAPPAGSHRDAPSAGEAMGPGLRGQNPETELTPPGCRQGLGDRTPPIPPRLWPPAPTPPRSAHLGHRQSPPHGQLPRARVCQGCRSSPPSAHPLGLFPGQEPEPGGKPRVSAARGQGQGPKTGPDS